MSNSNSLSAVIDLLLKPIPFLPSGSFIVSTSADPKLAAKKRAARQGRAFAKKIKQADEGYSLKGLIEHGEGTPYSICGEDFAIDSDTWIFGEVKVGAYATVMGVRHSGVTYARKILVH